MKSFVGALAACAMLAASPAGAQGCLDRETLTAARVHEFSTMMLAVSLRCRAIGVDIGAGNSAMLATHGPVFAAAHRRLQAFFAPDEHAFDGYATRLGNRYGAGATDPANCRRFESVARDLAASPGPASLGRVVFAMVAQPKIAGPACPVR